MKAGSDFTLAHQVIELTIEVHRHIGPGLLESHARNVYAANADQFQPPRSRMALHCMVL